MTPDHVFQLGRYHDATRHSPVSVGWSRHRLDWSIKPLPFKIYRDLEATEPPPDVDRLCLLSNGVLRWRRYGRGEAYGFRAAPCTGALYHIEPPSPPRATSSPSGRHRSFSS